MELLELKQVLNQIEYPGIQFSVIPWPDNEYGEAVYRVDYKLRVKNACFDPVTDPEEDIWIGSEIYALKAACTPETLNKMALELIMLLLRHEACHFFKVGGVPIYDEHKYDHNTNLMDSHKIFRQQIGNVIDSEVNGKRRNRMAKALLSATA